MPAMWMNRVLSGTLTGRAIETTSALRAPGTTVSLTGSRGGGGAGGGARSRSNSSSAGVAFALRARSYCASASVSRPAASKPRA